MKRGVVAAGCGSVLALFVLLDRPPPAPMAVGTLAGDQQLPADRSATSSTQASDDAAGLERSAHAGDGVPHPITAEHLALYRDVDLLDGAWQAARAGDYAGAREQLVEHARAYPERPDEMREGMSLLIDCMQAGGADARARAQRFYDEQTHSMLRRRMRRHCLQR
jgi:hypothetical protein